MNDHLSESSYSTGSTQPPKSKRGPLALLLIVIIILCGIVSVMGILNIRLFQKIKKDSSKDMFSFSATAPSVSIAAAPTTSPEEDESENITLKLNQAPQSVDNFPQEGGLSLQEIYSKAIPSVVSITCTLKQGTATGSGVILTTDGYIVTNAHVIADARSLEVLLNDGTSYPARVVGIDEFSDLAVLFIEANHLTPAEFGDDTTLRVGDSVVAIGDPLGIELRGTMTNGIVSAINRDILSEGRTMTLIQTNAALNDGNSGGPLLNCYGQVIGINTMKIGDNVSAAGVEGLGFAIPSTTIKTVVDQLISQGYVSGRPTLGIEGEALSSFYQHYYRLPAGVYVTHVEQGSDAHRVGIEEGDLLLSIGGTRVTSYDELRSAVLAWEVGDTVEVVVYRGGQQYLVELTLSEDKG